jgi:hypothetical protein
MVVGIWGIEKYTSTSTYSSATPTIARLGGWTVAEVDISQVPFGYAGAVNISSGFQSGDLLEIVATCTFINQYGPTMIVYSSSGVDLATISVGSLLYMRNTPGVGYGSSAPGDWSW